MKKDCTNCGKLRTDLCLDPGKCIRHGYSDWEGEKIERSAAWGQNGQNKVLILYEKFGT